jgi:hypothetical protein
LQADSYCSVPVVAADGTCPSGVCVRCADALARFYQQPAPATYGHYPLGCTDGVGYTWAPCDAAALPANAIWTSNTWTVGASRGCAWACAPLTALPWNGGCLPCLPLNDAKAQCVAGQVLRACGASGYAACQPCTGPLPNALMAWTSNAPYFTQCTLDCENGVAFRLATANSSECRQCSRVACALGTQYVPCIVTRDASCTSCAAVNGNEEWHTPGSCLTRCVAGYYRDGTGACVACAAAVGVCPLGQYPSSQCAAPEERLAPPTCIPCPTEGVYSALVLGLTTWARAGSCARRCMPGLVPGSSVPTASVYYHNMSAQPCVRCDPALCGQPATVGVCDDLAGTLVCNACPPPDDPTAMVYDTRPQALNAGVYACAQLLVPVAVAPETTPSSSSSTSSSTVDTRGARRMGGYARPGLAYPTRKK